MKLSFELKITGALAKALANKKPIDDVTAKSVGIDVVEAIKDTVSRGVSPIDKEGKFPRYKNPKRYPGGLKPISPVNLKLSGDFLNALTHRIVPSEFGKGTEIFFTNNQEVKERGHRNGANGQPERPMLPTERGEDFIRQIRKIYQDYYRQRIIAVLKGEG